MRVTPAGAAVSVATAILLLPLLVFRYVPAVDLPQHMAVTSMLLDQGGQAFGEFYEPALLRTLYWLPYGLWMALAKVSSLEIAMRLVLLLSMAVYPISIAVLLRVLGKPVGYALLALPLVYNLAFFWGFLSFNLAVGMGLLAWALILRPRPRLAGDLLLALLCVAVVLTHGYGVGMILGFAGMLWCFDRSKATLRRVLPVLPALLGVIIWSRLAEGAPSDVEIVFDSPLVRLGTIGVAILGGYAKFIDTLLLMAWLGVFLLFSPGRLLTRQGWLGLTRVERAISAFSFCNVLFYLVVPNSFAAVQQIAFRHALIATMVMPLLVPNAEPAVVVRRGRAALGLLAGAAIVLAWVQFARFDGEARGFSALVERVPPRPRIVSVIHDATGAVTRMPVYWHFAAYVQATRGGFLECSFPELFWNIPMRLRQDQPLLDSRMGCVGPEYVDARNLPPWADTIISRGGAESEVARFEEAAFKLELERLPWRLYLRGASGSDADLLHLDDVLESADGLEQRRGNRIVEAHDRDRGAS